VRKYILISIILVCVFGCGNQNLDDKINGLENENNNLGLELQKLNTDLGASSNVVKDITALIKNIQETEIKIEERKHRLLSAKEVENTLATKEDLYRLRSVIEVENTVDMKEDIFNIIQGLYDNLKKHRKKAVELQKKLDSLVAANAQQNELIPSLKKLIQEKTIKVEHLENAVDSLKKHVAHLENKQEKLNNKISNMESELNFKEKEVSRKELEIKNLNHEINTIYYVIGNSKELKRKKIIDKKSISRWSRFRSKYVLGSDFTLAEFKQEKTTLTTFRIDGKIKKLLPYRHQNHYDISYDNGLSFINIKDPKNFWHQKYLVVVTN
jgi:chromosome segregation ATPase